MKQERGSTLSSMPMKYRPIGEPRKILFRYLIPNAAGQVLMEDTPGGLQHPSTEMFGHSLQSLWCVEPILLLKEKYGVDATIRFVLEGFQDVRQEDGTDRVTLVMEVRSWPETLALKPCDEVLPERSHLPFFQQKGWFARTEEWFQQRVPGGRLEQLFNFPASCLLGTEKHALKATSALECHITRWLADHHLDAVPTVMDIDAEQGLLLTTFVEGALLKDLLDLEIWQRTFQTMGNIQRHSMKHLQDLKALGVPVLEQESLLQTLKALLNDPDFLNTQNLSTAHLALLEHLKPTLLQHTEELLSSPLLTLIHGDFHPFNVIAPGVIIDWAEVKISHPFLDVAQCIGRMPLEMKPHAEVLQEAYLELWHHLMPAAQARQQFDRARIVIRLIHACKGYRLAQTGNPNPMAGFQLRAICQEHSAKLSSCGLPLPT